MLRELLLARYLYRTRTTSESNNPQLDVLQEFMHCEKLMQGVRIAEQCVHVLLDQILIGDSQKASQTNETFIIRILLHDAVLLQRVQVHLTLLVIQHW